uniref:Uncharacterized protein n=1 Tax=Malurus cyaneus samueli TaxID=2593467 RepID=A0A8C5UG63_9PASS
MDQAVPNPPCPSQSSECHSSLPPGHLQDGHSKPPGQPLPRLSTLSMQKFLLMSPEPPLASLRPFPLVLSLFPGQSPTPPASPPVRD